MNLRIEVGEALINTIISVLINILVMMAFFHLTGLAKLKTMTDDWEQQVISLEEKIEEKITEFEQRVDERLTELEQRLDALEERVEEKVTEQGVL